MTNSMTNLEFIKNKIEDSTNVIKTDIVDNQQIAFEVEKKDIHYLLSILKSEGWKQLSYLSAIDWLEEGKFELVYIVFNWDRPVYIQLRTKIDRQNPNMNTIIPIYPGAKYYEREAFEFFGIAFPGNPDYQKQLILENWDDLPPLRKDFDPKAYSDKKYSVREYPQDFSIIDKKNNRLERRNKREERANSLRTGGKKS